jgi:hypothetical protein
MRDCASPMRDYASPMHDYASLGALLRNRASGMTNIGNSKLGSVIDRISTTARGTLFPIMLHVNLYYGMFGGASGFWHRLQRPELFLAAA